LAAGNPISVTVLDVPVLLAKLGIPYAGVGPVGAPKGGLMSGIGGTVDRVLGVLGLGGRGRDGKR
jgi:hypothetical protein